MFGNVSDEGEFSNIAVLPKADLLAPTPTIENRTEFQSVPLSEVSFSPQVTVDLDGTGETAYMVSRSGVPGVVQLPTVEDPAGSPVLGCR